MQDAHTTQNALQAPLGWAAVLKAALQWGNRRSSAAALWDDHREASITYFYFNGPKRVFHFRKSLHLLVRAWKAQLCKPPNNIAFVTNIKPQHQIPTQQHICRHGASTVLPALSHNNTNSLRFPHFTAKHGLSLLIFTQTLPSNMQFNTSALVVGCSMYQLVKITTLCRFGGFSFFPPKKFVYFQRFLKEILKEFESTKTHKRRGRTKGLKDSIQHSLSLKATGNQHL